MKKNQAVYSTKIQKQSSSKHCHCKKLNNIFIDIGLNLLKAIHDSSKPFRHSSLNSLLLKPTIEYEIHKVLFQINKGKTLDLLGIPVKNFKVNVSILSNPVSFIINRSFE